MFENNLIISQFLVGLRSFTSETGLAYDSHCKVSEYTQDPQLGGVQHRRVTIYCIDSQRLALICLSGCPIGQAAGDLRR